MAKNRAKGFSEYKINSLLTEKLKSKNLLVLNRVRLSPAEFDVVILDRTTLQLVNIEIKKNNWERLFQQAQRGKLYCHYSIVMVPITSKGKIDIKSFNAEGIGVIYYQERENDIDLIFELEPQKSQTINRTFKKLLYEQIQYQYGDGLKYA